MANENVFGQNLTLLRKKTGLTRRELAEKLGINENTLTGYERDGHEPKYSILAKIADFFGVSTDNLIRPEMSGHIPNPAIIMVTKFSINVDNKEYDEEIISVENLNEMSNLSDNFIKNLYFMFPMAKEILNVNPYEPCNSTEIKLRCDLKTATLNLNFKIDKKPIDSTDEFKEV